jgi:4-amino-4-deoxy-L-arabinose transferase-like glycosyltransferase
VPAPARAAPTISAAAKLALILGVATLLRVHFFTGYTAYDDGIYIQRAFDLSLGRLDAPTTHWAARVGLVVPTAIAYRLFGFSPATTVAFPFLCSLASILVAGEIGRRLYGVHAGLIAAFLFAVLPMDVLFATMLFPTAPVLLFAGGALCAFVLAERDGRPLLYLLSGLGLGLAGLANEASLMVVVVYPVYVLAVRRPHRLQLFVLLGLALAIGIDPLVHALMGAPLARLEALSHTKTVQGTDPDVGYSGFTFWWIAEPLVRLFSERTFGLFPLLVVPAVALRLVRPADTSDRALALIVVVGFLWISFGTVSPNTYAPLDRLPRYLAPIVMPGLLLGARELAERPSRRVRLLVLGVLGTSSLGCLLLDSGSALRPYEALREVLAAARPSVVTIEPARRFPLLLAERFAPPYQLVLLGDETPRGALVVASSREVFARLESAGAVPVARIEPPETPYLRLLRSPLVARVLALVRPAQRLDEYARRRAPWELRVYRVP